MAKQIKMPCGWMCGALLNSTEIRRHFKACPRRDLGSAVPVEPREPGLVETADYLREMRVYYQQIYQIRMPSDVASPGRRTVEEYEK